MFLNSLLYTRAQNYDPLAGVGDEISECLNYKRFCYDNAISGGAIGLINTLQDEQGNPAQLPLNSVIMSVMFDTGIALVGTSATIAVGCNSTNDLKTATAITAWSTAGTITAGIPVMTAATAVKVVAGSGSAGSLTRRGLTVTTQLVTITIATTILTAGRFYIHTVFARSNAT